MNPVSDEIAPTFMMICPRSLNKFLILPFTYCFIESIRLIDEEEEEEKNLVRLKRCLPYRTNEEKETQDRNICYWINRSLRLLPQKYVGFSYLLLESDLSLIGNKCKRQRESKTRQRDAAPFGN